MHYELPINEDKYKQIQAFNTKHGEYVLFRLANGMHSDTLFILVHGASDGTMYFKGHHLTSTQVLRALIDTVRIQDKGITKVYSISCHGGTQPSVCIDGITFESMHTCTSEIHTKANATIDDEYFLSVHVPEVVVA